MMPLGIALLLSILHIASDKSDIHRNEVSMIRIGTRKSKLAFAVCPVSEGAVFQVCLRGPAGDGAGPVGELYGTGQRPRQLAFRRVHRCSGGLFAAVPVSLHL